MRLLLLVFTCHTVCCAKWPLRAPHAPDVPASFDCAMRKAAYTFGRTLIPRLGAFPDLFYALGLNEPACEGELQALDAGQPPPEPPAATLPSDAVYVSPSSQAGPQGDGSLDAPMRSLQLAADAAAWTVGKTVVLRGGTHYLREPLRLEPWHSGLSLLGFPVEAGGANTYTSRRAKRQGTRSSILGLVEGDTHTPRVARGVVGRWPRSALRAPARVCPPIHQARSAVRISRNRKANKAQSPKNVHAAGIIFAFADRCLPYGTMYFFPSISRDII